MFRPADVANSVGSSNVLVHEPQRYHFAMWEHFYALVNGSESSGPSYRESVELRMSALKKDSDIVTKRSAKPSAKPKAKVAAKPKKKI
jgi:hypothetical protein